MVCRRKSTLGHHHHPQVAGPWGHIGSEVVSHRVPPAAYFDFRTCASRRGMDNTAVTARVDFLRQTALDFPPETARHAERVDGRLGSP